MSSAAPSSVESLVVENLLKLIPRNKITSIGYEEDADGDECMVHIIRLPVLIKLLSGGGVMSPDQAKAFGSEVIAHMRHVRHVSKCFIDLKKFSGEERLEICKYMTTDLPDLVPLCLDWLRKNAESLSYI